MLATAGDSLVAITVMLALWRRWRWVGLLRQLLEQWWRCLSLCMSSLLSRPFDSPEFCAYSVVLATNLVLPAGGSGWENGWLYDSRLKDRIVVDVRGQAFSDRDLLELDKLPVCQVLDAQGTDLTDAGLALMHGLINLRCLVVRRTQ